MLYLCVYLKNRPNYGIYITQTEVVAIRHDELPLLDIFPNMKHSYIIELKYADTDAVKRAIGTTQLHKIVVVYKGMEMRVCEEVLL